MSSWPARAVRATMIAAIVVLGVLLMARAHANAGLHAQRSPFAQSGRAVAMPSGFLADGSAFTPPAGARCMLVQYISSECEYCRAEQPVVNTLATRIAARGCALVVLAPSPEEMPLLGPRPHQTELAYIRPAWIEAALRLQVEPTTIVLGPGGKLVWFGLGQLTPELAAQALSGLQAALRR